MALPLSVRCPVKEGLHSRVDVLVSFDGLGVLGVQIDGVKVSAEICVALASVGVMVIVRNRTLVSRLSALVLSYKTGIRVIHSCQIADA
jgi:hypothetical protein